MCAISKCNHLNAQEALRAKLDAARKRLKTGVRISDKLQVGC